MCFPVRLFNFTQLWHVEENLSSKFAKTWHKIFFSIISTAEPKNLITGAHLGGGEVDIHPSPQNEECLPTGHLPWKYLKRSKMLFIRNHIPRPAQNKILSVCPWNVIFVITRTNYLRITRMKFFWKLETILQQTQPLNCQHLTSKYQLWIYTLYHKKVVYKKVVLDWAKP